MTDPWATVDVLNGPRVAEWIKKEFPRYKQYETVRRRVDEWERGLPVSIDTLDFQLTKLGFPLSLVPDEVFTETREPIGEPIKGKQKRSHLEPKWCEACGKPIPTRWPNGARKHPDRWAKARHCSNACRIGQEESLEFGKAAA